MPASRDPLKLRTPAHSAEHSLISAAPNLHRTERTAVTWDVEPESDAAIGSDPGRIVAHVLEHTRAGCIIRLHPMFASNAPTRAAVGKIIDALIQRGCAFTTASELAGECRHGA